MKHLQDVPFTHFLSLSFPTPDITRAPLSFENHCISGTKEFFRRLDYRVFGQKANQPENTRLRRAVFFENKSKYGNSVHFHGHALVSVPRNYSERFETYFPIMWSKVFPSPKKIMPFELSVYDQDQLVSYASKYFTSEFDFIADLT